MGEWLTEFSVPLRGAQSPLFYVELPQAAQLRMNRCFAFAKLASSTHHPPAQTKTPTKKRAFSFVWSGTELPSSCALGSTP